MSEDLARLIQIVSKVPLFSGLGQEVHTLLANSLSRVDLPEGNILFEENQPVDGLFILDQGYVRKFHWDSPERIQISGRGDIVGEENLFGLARRVNTVQADTPCVLWFLDNYVIQKSLIKNSLIQGTINVLFQSQQLIGKEPMPWLQADEQVFIMTRKHPFFLFSRSIWPIIGFALLLIVTSKWLFVSSPLLTTFLIGTFVACGLWLAWNIHNWANDFYIITNKRMVWVERVSGFYDSRQEAPLSTLISVGVNTTQLGAFIGYSDVIVRTFIGDIRFNRVQHAKEIGNLIETFWLRRKFDDQIIEEKMIRSTIQKNLNNQEIDDRDGIGFSKNELRDNTTMPIRETKFFEWLFSDFLKVRFEVGGTTTYRKHWFVLLKKSLLPILFCLSSAIFVITVATKIILWFDYPISLMMGSTLFLVSLFWLIYIYSDWRNDIFQLTPNQVIDIDRKPFGRERRRSAPLDNILSIEYERNGLIPVIFDFGTVFITIGNTQLTFNDVYHPSLVQQDIFSRMSNYSEEKNRQISTDEREKISQWLKIYHQETHLNADTQKLRKNQP